MQNQLNQDKKLLSVKNNLKRYRLHPIKDVK